MSSEPARKIRKSKTAARWNQLPDDAEGDAAGDAIPLIGQARDGASRLGKQLNRGFRRASRQLVPHASSDLQSLYAGVDLPSIHSDDALEGLAARLDGEADLWRGLAIRAFTRAVWADRFTQAVAVVGALGCGGLAAVAAMGGLFGSEQLLQRAALVVAGAAALLIGVGMVLWASASVRRAQQAIAGSATRRADLAEMRLHRLAVVMAARSTDEVLFKEALQRLEMDVLAPLP